MSFVCLLSFSSQSRLSFVSVVFDFNNLLSDVAPASPISFNGVSPIIPRKLPVCEMIVKKKEQFK